MPQVRNDGTNPIAVGDTIINPGATITVPDRDWKQHVNSETSQRVLGEFLTVVAGGKKGKAKGEAAPTDPDAKTLADIFTEMLEEDPQKAENSWWSGAEGKPDAREVSERAGRKVSAKERDKAWADYNADPDADDE